MSKTSHQGILPLVHGILAADTSPLGMTSQQVLRACGLEPKQCTAALYLLKQSGRCFSSGIHHSDRFFYATAERMEACREAVAARLVEVRKQRRAEMNRKHAQRARERLARKPKPEKAPKPAKSPKAKAAPKPKREKPAKPAGVTAPVHISSAPRRRWDAAPVVVPAHVKVTVCQGYVPRTFAPPPFFRGEYLTEWQQLRSAKK